MPTQQRHSRLSSASLLYRAAAGSDEAERSPIASSKRARINRRKSLTGRLSRAAAVYGTCQSARHPYTTNMGNRQHCSVLPTHKSTQLSPAAAAALSPFAACCCPTFSHQSGGDVGSRAVSSSQPVGVMSSVCSNCAERCPSSVAEVQPSGQVLSRCDPRFIIGSVKQYSMEIQKKVNQ